LDAYQIIAKGRYRGGCHRSPQDAGGQKQNANAVYNAATEQPHWDGGSAQNQKANGDTNAATDNQTMMERMEAANKHHQRHISARKV